MRCSLGLLIVILSGCITTDYQIDNQCVVETPKLIKKAETRCLLDWDKNSLNSLPGPSNTEIIKLKIVGCNERAKRQFCEITQPL